MSLYQQNIKAIEQKKSSIYGRLIEKEKNNNLISAVHSCFTMTQIETKEEKKALIIEKASKLYRLNSSYKPLTEAKTWADQFSFINRNKTVLLFGLGNGIMAKELLSRLGENEPLLIYEPSVEVFQYIIQNEDLSELLNDRRVSIIIEEVNEYEFTNLLQAFINWQNAGSKIVCLHPQYDNLFPESYKRYLLAIRDQDIVAYKNEHTDARFGKAIVLNTLNNLQFLKQGKFIAELKKEEDKNIPAIIVSAGPSLRKNVELLKQAEGKAIIIVVDRALEYLLNNNIEPDFVISMDPMLPLHLFSKRINLTIPLLCSVNASSSVMNAHKGEKFFVHYNDYVKTMLHRLDKPIPEYNPGGSVANAAFYVCVILKCKKVILVGQDLAYDGEYTHLEGEKDNSLHDQDTMWVEDINGNRIKTRRDWYTYLEWFQNAIESKRDMEVIDATEGGAKIKGTKIMNLQKAIDTYCIKQVNCKEIFDRTLPSMNDEDMRFAIQYLKDSVADFNIISEKAFEGISFCNNLLIEYNKKKINDAACSIYMKNLKSINDLILSKPISELIDYYIKKETAEDKATVYQIHNKDQQDNITFYQNSKKTYQYITNATNVLKPRIETLIKQLSS